MSGDTLTFEQWMKVYVFKILHYSEDVRNNEGLMGIFKKDYQDYLRRLALS
jgi:hypothetical protein